MTLFRLVFMLLVYLYRKDCCVLRAICHVCCIKSRTERRTKVCKEGMSHGVLCRNSVCWIENQEFLGKQNSVALSKEASFTFQRNDRHTIIGVTIVTRRT